MKKRGFFVVRDEFRKTTGEVILPKRASKFSAGYDIFLVEELHILPNQIVKVPTDIKVYMQANEVFLLYIRSSLGLRGLLLANSTGIIDADYYGNRDNDGNLILALKNNTDKEMFFEAKSRVAQGIFMPYLLADDDQAEEAREGGFGHSGI